ncbi:MAG: XRE family transcriptional regulator [Cytophagales bacterium]|nr:MAG: XRE family transcriptional regulator [Cytophagales bacterium]
MITQKIKIIRELKNYTQDYMAEQLGVSQNTYSRMENGQIKITIDRFQDIANILEVFKNCCQTINQFYTSIITNLSKGVSYNMNVQKKF